jgi:LysM repeat protein
VDGVRLVSGHRSAARFAASAAFLAAAIVAVLIVRSGLSDGSPSQPASPGTTQTQGGAATGTTRADVTLPAATTAVEPVFYVIEAGDTLETVAEEQGTTVERLLILNPDVDPVALTIGQRIRVK